MGWDEGSSTGTGARRGVTAERKREKADPSSDACRVLARDDSVRR